MPKPQCLTYFKANLEDKPGALLALMRGLKTKGLGVSALWGFSTRAGRAELYVIPRNPDKLRGAWKAAGILADEGAGFLLKGTDRTGALVKPLETIVAAGVNILAIHALAVGGNFGSFLWVAPQDVEKTKHVLGAK